MYNPLTTKCPKVGAEQWTCKYFECICHLKSDLCRKNMPKNECRYNPRLGCDCGHHKPRIWNGKDYV